MDLISKLDLEKAQLQRLTAGASVTASKTWSPSKGTAALSMPELQKRLDLERSQRQQVTHPQYTLKCFAHWYGPVC